MLEYISDSDPSELRDLCASVRKFAEASLRSADITPAFRRSDFEAMAALGLTGMSVGEQYGGTALSNSEIAAAIFEVSRAQLGPAVYLSVHLMVARLIAAFRSSAEHDAALAKLASGKALGAFCLTEAEAGSDAGSLRLKAVRENNQYVLTGEKLYITSGGVADIYLVFARTGGPGHDGISAFVVDRQTAGLTFGKPEKKMGCEGAPICAVHFDRCAITEHARLGAEGDGYRIALSGLQGGRVNIAASACGIASRSIDLATEHVKNRKQFGQPLSSFQGLQFMLSDMVALLRASILLTRAAAEDLDRGSRQTASASIAKCFATDAAMKITTDAVQLLGGAGYLAEYEVERLMRDAKMLQIVEGTNQIQRTLISRALLSEQD